MSTPPYAHTKKGCPRGQWESLYGPDGHAEKVARIMESFRVPFAPGVLEEGSPIFRILGLYHDMGKASAAFQQYLIDSEEKGSGASVNHKTAAARWFWEPRNLLALAAAYAFEGHHSGLPDGAKNFGDALRVFDTSEAVAALPVGLQARPALGMRQNPLLLPGKTRKEMSYLYSLFIRMLHSCLVDADWLATEDFMEPETAAERRSIYYDSLDRLSERLENYIRAREQWATGHINGLRREIHHACHAAAEMEPGVFQLNVPTGGGKTLSSLSFALEHAGKHGLQRVIYVIPFTSIIEQTAQEFRAVLGPANVVEHQSNIALENDTRGNRFSAENWDAPLIVTTSVQFFESLFSASNRRCRKLHNVAHSVIVFDEAQSLPANLLQPCVAAMKGLQALCGCSLVLCTATQPNLTNHEGFDIGWEPGQIRSMLGVELEQRLAREMKRVEVLELGKLDNTGLVNHFLETGEASALFIVNLTRQAQDLYQALQSEGIQGLYHLSARMCPAHRLEVLTEVRARLKEGLPTVLISTRVVEAGVDVSFPIVYRDRCGLDSLAQSAGRCNRHGEAPMGLVFSYAAAEENYALPASFIYLKHGIYAREDVMAMYPEAEPFSPEVVEAYFTQYYNCSQAQKWDVPGVMNEVVSSAPATFGFPEVEERFRLIPDGQVTVMVPYTEGSETLRQRLLETAKFKRMPSREDFRLVQQYSVSIYSTEWEKISKECDCVHPEAQIYMAPASLYDSALGLLREPTSDIYIC